MVEIKLYSTRVKVESCHRQQYLIYEKKLTIYLVVLRSRLKQNFRSEVEPSNIRNLLLFESRTKI